SSGTVASSRKASKATFALNAASNFLRDFVISLAPLVKTEQDATHLNRWSQNRGPLQTIEQFDADLEGNLYKIWNRMSSGSYFPPPVRAVTIPKKSGGERILGM